MKTTLRFDHDLMEAHKSIADEKFECKIFGGMLNTCDPFGNDRDSRITKIWVDERLNTLLSKKSHIQQARDILTRQRYV